MNLKKFLFYTLAVILGGCIPSLHPLFTENKDIVFEEGLLGLWVGNNPNETWEVKKYGNENDKRYRTTFNSNGKAGEFLATLGILNDMLFFDLFPLSPEPQGNDFYKLHLLSVHTFIKVEQLSPTLKVRTMDPDKMKKMLENDPNLIKHEFLEGRIILTASTEELQKFMKNYANTEGLFGEPATFQKSQQEVNEPNNIDANDVPKKY